MSEIMHKLVGKPYIEINVVSGGKILEKNFFRDKGQKWVHSKKLGMGFIVPDRGEGLSHGRKTVFYYGIDNALPLSLEETEEIISQNLEVIYTSGKGNSLIKKKIPTSELIDVQTTKKAVKMGFVCTSIETTVLKSIMHSKVVFDLMKNASDMWESLKLPLTIGIIAICAVLIFYTM